MLEYLIKNGSEKVADNARDHIYEMKALKNFQHIDEKGKDQGLNGIATDYLLQIVRNRADEILILLNNPDKIKDERVKARENKGKYGAVSSTSGSYSNTGSHSNTSRYGGYGSDSIPSATTYENHTKAAESYTPKAEISKATIVVSSEKAPVQDLLDLSGGDDEWSDFSSAAANNYTQKATQLMMASFDNSIQATTLPKTNTIQSNTSAFQSTMPNANMQPNQHKFQIPAISNQQYQAPVFQIACI